jgi:hypothetical protein
MVNTPWSISHFKNEQMSKVAMGWSSPLTLALHWEHWSSKWYARDIVRLIQDMRKEAAYNVTDRINISITGDDSVKNIITHFGNMIAEETLGTIAESLSDADVSKEEITRWEHHCQASAWKLHRTYSRIYP